MVLTWKELVGRYGKLIYECSAVNGDDGSRDKVAIQG